LFVDDEEPNLVVFEAVCGDNFPVVGRTDRREDQTEVA
jgi:hypothetical protein